MIRVLLTIIPAVGEACGPLVPPTSPQPYGYTRLGQALSDRLTVDIQLFSYAGEREAELVQVGHLLYQFGRRRLPAHFNAELAQL